MKQSFAELLAVGGKSNSLGEAERVIQLTLNDQSRLEELYGCLFSDDAWVRMRAADALEKVCREHPDWLLPYIDRFGEELTTSKQPSIQWHLAQIYRQVELTGEQKLFALSWLKELISTKEVDWIVASSAMDTLLQFTKDGSFSAETMKDLLGVQQQHKSKAIVKRAGKLLAELPEQ